jgi:predicted nucleotidyltransferase
MAPRRLRVFGSVARREERVDSDVDFLVDFPRGYGLFPKRWNLILDYVPDDVFIEPEVAMSEHVTKSGDPSLFDRRVLKANVLWNLLVGFAKHEKVPEHGVAGQLVVEKLLT